MMSLRLRLGLSGALAAACVTAAAAQAPAPSAPTATNPWTMGAPFPEPSEEVLGATAGGKFYVFAGLAPGWKPKALVVEYDPACNHWTKKNPMQLACHHVAFVGLGDKVYACGGLTLPQSGPARRSPCEDGRG